MSVQFWNHCSAFEFSWNSVKCFVFFFILVKTAAYIWGRLVFEGGFYLRKYSNCWFETNNIYVSRSELLSLWQKLGRGVGPGLKYYLRGKIIQYSIYKILWNKIWYFDRLWPCKHFNIDHTTPSVTLFLNI